MLVWRVFRELIHTLINFDTESRMNKRTIQITDWCWWTFFNILVIKSEGFSFQNYSNNIIV